MSLFIKHSIRFILIILIQALILNQIELGFGVQVMISPLFILLLPVGTSVSYLLLLSFIMGILIDSISNTYGLHTSALLTVGYLKPFIFKAMAPRDGYDPIIETNIFHMGKKWFFKTFGLLLIIHHFWFFLIEIFKLNEILFVFQKVCLSTPLSLLTCVLLQYLFLNKKNEI